MAHVALYILVFPDDGQDREVPWRSAVLKQSSLRFARCGTPRGIFPWHLAVLTVVWEILPYLVWVSVRCKSEPLFGVYKNTRAQAASTKAVILSRSHTSV